MDSPDEKVFGAPESGQDQSNLNPVAVIDAAAPTGWRVWLAKAAVQLIAGTEKGAIAYGQVRERHDTIEGRSIVSKALAQAVATQAVSDPDTMERAKARFLGTALQQQENLETVINGASHYLALLPAPASSDEATAPVEDEAPKSSGKSHPKDAEQEGSRLNPDWAASFAGIAQDANSDQLRDRLSRVLAGEIASPGTYTRATVRAIAELERSDLEAVQSVMPFVLGSRLVRTSAAEPRPTIDELLPLSDAVLITDANAMMSEGTPAATVANQLFMYGGSEWALMVYANVGQSINFPVIPLTRTGVAVIDLLGRPDERVILRRVAEEISPHIYTKVLLGRKTSANSIGAPVEQLFPKPMVQTINTTGALSPFAPAMNLGSRSPTSAKE